MNEGILIINKQSGMTSHDVVARVRRLFRMKRVGHAGTLDPLATGVLVILLGKCTKLFNEFVGFDKAYRSTLRLGVKTTSADIQGDVIEQRSFEDVTQDHVEKAFQGFKGDIEQLPPMVSAVKHKGRRLYQLARQGVQVERQPRQVTIHELSLRQFNQPFVEFYMHCSKGTYVRQLADDVGDLLGCGACISQIERTKVGPFTLDQAVLLEDVNESHIRDWRP